jgi:hypothetical protein
LKGTSGVTVWSVTESGKDDSVAPAASRRHVVVAWSSPRNRLLYENTLAVGILIGPPTKSLSDLFNEMYYGKAIEAFYTR